MCKQEVIKPATNEWVAPIVFYKKMDGTSRACIDYRRLIASDERDSYLIPRLDECISSHGQSMVFFSLGANGGYWQVKIGNSNRGNTAIISHHGLYRIARMSFELKNAPNPVHQAMDAMLVSVRWHMAFI